MGNLICVADMRNPASIMAAFQRAMDAVVNRKAIEDLFRQEFNDRNYQYVHPHGTMPALGGASLILNKSRGATSSVFLTVYAPGHHGGEALYAPERLASRLVIVVPGTQLVARVEGPRPNKEYRAHLIVPTATLCSRPSVIVKIG